MQISNYFNNFAAGLIKTVFNWLERGRPIDACGYMTAP